MFSINEDLRMNVKRYKSMLLYEQSFCLKTLLMQVGHDIDHFTSPEGVVGKPETNFKNRPHSFFVLSPCRSCQVRAFPQKNKVDNITCTAHLLLFAPNATKLISMFCRVVSPIFLSADDISEISITLLLNHTSILFFCWAEDLLLM